MDPIADQFAWVSPFNYAENMVPGAIDLWGLQAMGFETWLNTQITRHLRGEITTEEYLQSLREKGKGGMIATMLAIPGPFDDALFFGVLPTVEVTAAAKTTAKVAGRVGFLVEFGMA